MKTRQVACIALAIILVSQIIGIASAEMFYEGADEPEMVGGKVSPITAFFNNLFHSLGIQTFSVVGDSRSCGLTGGQPNQYWYNLATGTSFSKTLSETTAICGSGGGLYDVFSNGWIRYKEYKDTVNIYCDIGPCQVQLYCCPKPECTSNADCSGGTCNTKTCTLISGTSGYRCLDADGNPDPMPYQYSSYKYCTLASTMDCYYRDGTTCYKRTYDKLKFPNPCESYDYNGRALFTLQSTCLGQLGKCFVDDECPSGKVCQSGTCVTPTTSNCDQYGKSVGDTLYWCVDTQTVGITTCSNPPPARHTSYYCPNYGTKTENGIEICKNNLCNVQTSVTKTCSDTDGKNYQTKGSVTWIIGTSSKVYEDRCIISGGLIEYYCDGNTEKEEVIVCDCSGGKCTTAPEVESVDCIVDGGFCLFSSSCCSGSCPWDFKCAPSACTPQTCSQLGKSCGSWDNGCGGSINCGTCTGTQTCSADGICIEGGTTPTCSDGIQNQGETGIDCGGPCTACEIGEEITTPIVNDPEIKAQVMKITIIDPITRNAIPGDQPIKPSDTIKINYQIKTTLGDLKEKIGKPALINVANLKEIISSKEYLIEIGLIPKSVAFGVNGWFPENKDIGIFSFFQPFATATGVDTECCKGQTNIAAKTTTISEGNFWIGGVLKTFAEFVGLYSNTPDSTELIFQDSVTLQVPDSALTDTCPVDGVSTPYWNGEDPQYVLYLVIKNGCKYKEGVYAGYDRGAYMLKPVKVDINYSGLAGGAGDEELCLDNADCESCNCDKPWYSYTKRCQKENKCTGGISGTNRTYSLKDLKKIALTKDEIKIATTPFLFASSCYKPDECLPRENYTVSCNSIESLRAEGTIPSDSAVSSLMDYGKGIVIGGTAGAAIGAATGVFICNGLMVAKEVAQTAITTVGTGGVATVPEVTTKTVSVPAQFVACALWGGAVGGTIGGLIGGIIIKMDADADPLVKAFNAKDSSSVGICTAEPTTVYDIGGFLKKIGKALPITGDQMWDGIIVIIVGIIILMILMNMLNRR